MVASDDWRGQGILIDSGGLLALAALVVLEMGYMLNDGK